MDESLLPLAPEAPQLELVMRQFWPIQAGAAQRHHGYAPGLRQRGVGMRVWTRQTQPQLPLAQISPNQVAIERLAAGGRDSQGWDSLLFEGLANAPIADPSRHVLLTNLAFAHTRELIRRLRARGHPALWMGSVVEDLSLGKSWLGRLRERLRLHWTLSVFDGWVVGSKVMRDWLQEAWIPAPRIHCIGNGVDLNRFRPAPQGKKALRLELGLEAEEPVVLMVGAMIPRKGVDLLLDAWPEVVARQPKAKLILIGEFDRPTIVQASERDGLQEFQQRLRQQMEPWQKSGHVLHLPHCSGVEKWMQAANLLVLPSQREGVGNVILEAMACATACLLVDFIGLARDELGPCGRTWALANRSAEGLAEAMLHWLARPELLSQMGEAAAAHARGHFDLQRSLDDYAALIGALTNRFSGRA